jgi:hypothetical protein
VKHRAAGWSRTRAKQLFHFRKDDEEMNVDTNKMLADANSNLLKRLQAALDSLELPDEKGRLIRNSATTVWYLEFLQHEDHPEWKEISEEVINRAQKFSTELALMSKGYKEKDREALTAYDPGEDFINSSPRRQAIILAYLHVVMTARWVRWHAGALILAALAILFLASPETFRAVTWWLLPAAAGVAILAEIEF